MPNENTVLLPAGASTSSATLPVATPHKYNYTNNQDIRTWCERFTVLAETKTNSRESVDNICIQMLEKKRRFSANELQTLLYTLNHLSHQHYLWSDALADFEASEVTQLRSLLYNTRDTESYKLFAIDCNPAIFIGDISSLSRDGNDEYKKILFPRQQVWLLQQLLNQNGHEALRDKLRYPSSPLEDVKQPLITTMINQQKISRHDALWSLGMTLDLRIDEYDLMYKHNNNRDAPTIYRYAQKKNWTLFDEIIASEQNTNGFVSKAADRQTLFMLAKAAADKCSRAGREDRAAYEENYKALFERFSENALESIADLSNAELRRIRGFLQRSDVDSAILFFQKLDDLICKKEPIDPNKIKQIRRLIAKGSGWSWWWPNPFKNVNAVAVNPQYFEALSKASLVLLVVLLQERPELFVSLNVVQQRILLDKLVAPENQETITRLTTGPHSFPSPLRELIVLDRSWKTYSTNQDTTTPLDTLYLFFKAYPTLIYPNNTPLNELKRFLEESLTLSSEEIEKRALILCGLMGGLFIKNTKENNDSVQQYLMKLVELIEYPGLSSKLKNALIAHYNRLAKLDYRKINNNDLQADDTAHISPLPDYQKVEKTLAILRHQSTLDSVARYLWEDKKQLLKNTILSTAKCLTLFPPESVVADLERMFNATNSYDRHRNLAKRSVKVLDFSSSNLIISFTLQIPLFDPPNGVLNIRCQMNKKTKQVWFDVPAEEQRRFACLHGNYFYSWNVDSLISELIEDHYEPATTISSLPRDLNFMARDKIDCLGLDANEISQITPHLTAAYNRMQAFLEVYKNQTSFIHFFSLRWRKYEDYFWSIAHHMARNAQAMSPENLEKIIHALEEFSHIEWLVYKLPPSMEDTMMANVTPEFTATLAEYKKRAAQFISDQISDQIITCVQNAQYPLLARLLNVGSPLLLSNFDTAEVSAVQMPIVEAFQNDPEKMFLIMNELILLNATNATIFSNIIQEYAQANPNFTENPGFRNAFWRTIQNCLSFEEKEKANRLVEYMGIPTIMQTLAAILQNDPSADIEGCIRLIKDAHNYRDWLEHISDNELWNCRSLFEYSVIPVASERKDEKIAKNRLILVKMDKWLQLKMIDKATHTADSYSACLNMAAWWTEITQPCLVARYSDRYSEYIILLNRAPVLLLTYHAIIEKHIEAIKEVCASEDAEQAREIIECVFAGINQSLYELFHNQIGPFTEDSYQPNTPFGKTWQEHEQKLHQLLTWKNECVALFFKRHPEQPPFAQAETAPHSSASGSADLPAPPRATYSSISASADTSQLTAQQHGEQPATSLLS